MWRGFPIALATSGIRPEVTSNDVPRAKPASDCYLNTARLLGKKPSSCVVVEDSAHGIHAAVAASMRVLVVSPGAAIMGMRPIADVQYSDFLFRAMDQVANQVANSRSRWSCASREPRADLRAQAPLRFQGSAIGKSFVRREGTDVTIIATLLMMHRALEAAALLEKEKIGRQHRPGGDR